MADGRAVLGIETSCDETAASVVTDGVTVRSNVIASQHEIHAEYRGVVPELASRAHAERILPIVEAALAEAGAAPSEIAAVAVGHRPGLIGSLLVGVSAAKALAWTLGVPFVGVDHVQAHLYAGCLDREPPAWPALGLVVSGGHSSIFRCSSPTSIESIGRTIDDAVGEAFDKVATVLDVPYPGGPNLDKLARTGDDRAHDFPVSRLSKQSLDLSFSGVKTAVLYAAIGVPGSDVPAPALDDRRRADLAASFQRAAIRAVMLKLGRALDRETDGTTLLVGGGVSANSRLREELTEFAAAKGLDLRLPPMALCVDNAAMIAGLAWHQLGSNDWAGDELSLSAMPTTGCV